MDKNVQMGELEQTIQYNKYTNRYLHVEFQGDSFAFILIFRTICRAVVVVN